MGHKEVVRFPMNFQVHNRSISKNLNQPFVLAARLALNLSNHSCVCVLHRYVFPSTQVSPNGSVSATAAIGSNNNSTQNDTLMQENIHLRKELEVYVDKANRLQRVSKGVSTTVDRKTLKLRQFKLSL